MHLWTKKSRKDEKNGNSSLVFLNTPVSSENDDVIGVGTHVKKLNEAIDSGAQMIAITSPFGAGKTSIIELLSVSRAKCETSKKEKIVKISMWSKLKSGASEGDSVNLHRTFLYQLVSQIKPRRASYVSRRLNPNYGILRLHTNKAKYWFLVVVALLFMVLSWVTNSMSGEMSTLVPKFILDNSTVLSAISFTASILIGIIIVTRADIIYSLKNTGEGRKIDVDDIIDLYKDEILKPFYLEKKSAPRKRCGKHFIAIIEDLDRTTDHEAVITFLTELRRYCVFDGELKYKNRMSFVVNIKPESELNLSKDHQTVQEEKGESLFAKIFDYVLLLQTINIDNYDAILEGLLQSRIDQLKALGFNPDEEHLADTLPGMQWIIRERRIGIREIKERLNITFSLYESLKEKFPKSNISLEKCAAFAYLSTAFENEINSMNGREFAQLIDYYISNPSADYHSCDNVISGCSEDFKKTVWQLIDAKLIDSSYRSYFYNYPKTSSLYTADESKVINALLYDEKSSDILDAAERVHSAGSLAIQNGLRKVEQLGIQPPAIILESEALYVETLNYFPELIYKRMRLLDYNVAGAEKTVQAIIRVLSYDKSRHVYNNKVAYEYCKIWDNSFPSLALLSMRGRLCETFPEEIMWYDELFFNGHTIISEKEMGYLKLEDIIELIDLDSSEFSIKYTEYVQKRYSTNEDLKKSYLQVKGFMEKSLEILGRDEIAEILLNFMITSQKIEPKFEAEIFSLLINANTKKPTVEALFDKYQLLITIIAENEELTEQTISNISDIDRYDGYSEVVAKQLYKKGNYIDAALLAVAKDYTIDFMDPNILDSVKRNRDFILNHHRDLFEKLRLRLAGEENIDLRNYSFLFDSSCPIMTAEEIRRMHEHRVDDALVMNLIPATIVQVENINMLCKYFCRKTQLNSVGFSILIYISKFDREVAEACFLSLDFDKIQYRRMSADRKSNIKTTYRDILELETSDGKMRFMELTKDLDAKWETELIRPMATDSDLRRRYINLLNQNVKMTSATIQTICKLPIYPMIPSVTEKLFDAKKYTEYVLSKTMWEKAFVMEDLEKGSFLWKVYLDIFRSKNCQEPQKYMVRNESFLERIMNERGYSELDEESIMQMTGILQSADCIEFVYNNFGVDFALRYYCSILGFRDREAAELYTDIVVGEDKLLASDKLYECTHEKLLDGPLKAKYTRARNGRMQNKK